MASIKNLKTIFLIFALVLAIAVAGCTQKKEETPQQLPPELLKQLAKQAQPPQQLPPPSAQQPAQQRDLSFVNCVAQKNLESLAPASISDYGKEASSTSFTKDSFKFAIFFSNGSYTSTIVTDSSHIVYAQPRDNPTRKIFDVYWKAFSNEDDYNVQKSSIEDARVHSKPGIYQQTYDLRGASAYPRLIQWSGGTTSPDTYLFFDGTKKFAEFEFGERANLEEAKSIVAAYADQVCPK